MPNWCQNTVVVSGDKERIKSFFRSNRSCEQPLSFAKAVAEPEGLYQRPSNDNSIALLFGAKIDDDKLDWYHWHIRHWGSKWDANFEFSPPPQVETRSITYYFCTAWSPPAEWFKETAAIWPDLSFEIVYAEVGNDFAGRIVAENGKVIKEEDLEVEDVLKEDELFF